MELTTHKLIQILPLEEDLRQELIRDWDTMEPDERAEIERILWKTYYELYEARLQKNIQKKLESVGEEGSTATLDDHFYDEIEAETEKEMMQENVIKEDTAELTDVRNRLQTLMHSPVVN